MPLREASSAHAYVLLALVPGIIQKCVVLKTFEREGLASGIGASTDLGLYYTLHTTHTHTPAHTHTQRFGWESTRARKWPLRR